MDEPKDVNLNLRVGLLRKSEGGHGARKFGKILLIALGSLVALVVVVIGIAAIVYYAPPDHIESFTKYQSNDKKQPVEWRYTFVGETCTIYWKNTATAESGMYSRWDDNNQILYFNRAKGTMWLEGAEYTGRDDVKQKGDGYRQSNNIAPKRLKMERGRDRYTTTLTTAELVWIMFHNGDQSYLGFKARTSIAE